MGPVVGPSGRTAAPPSHDGDPPRPRITRIVAELPGAGPGRVAPVLVKRVVAKAGSAGTTGVAGRRATVRAGKTPGKSEVPTPSLTQVPQAPAQLARGKSSLPIATPAKITVPAALRDFLHSNTDLVTSARTSPSASPSPSYAFSPSDGSNNSPARSPRAAPRAPASASPAAIGAALRRGSSSAACVPALPGPGQPRGLVVGARRQLQLILRTKQTTAQSSKTAMEAGAGEDGYEPLDEPEILLPLSLRASPRSRPRRSTRPSWPVCLASWLRAEEERAHSTPTQAVSQVRLAARHTPVLAAVKVQAPSAAVPTSVVSRSETRVPVVLVLPAAEPAAEPPGTEPVDGKQEGTTATPTTAPTYCCVAVQTDERGVRDAAQQYDSDEDGPPSPASAVSLPELEEPHVFVDGPQATTPVDGEPSEAASHDSSLTSAPSSSGASSLDALPAGQALPDGDWLGREPSSSTALPPPAGSHGEGLGLGLSLGLAPKETSASGQAAASIILAPSYRNERTISTFGLASLSALDDAQLMSASPSAQSDGALVKKTPAQPNLAASPSASCASAPAASVPTVAAAAVVAVSSAEVPSRVEATAATAPSDLCALMGCDSWTSDSDEEPAAATVAVTATPGQSEEGTTVMPLNEASLDRDLELDLETDFEALPNPWLCAGRVAVAVAVPFGVPLAKRTLSRYTLSSAEVARGGQDGALAGRRGRGAPHLSWPDTGDAGLSQQGSEPSLSSGVAEDGSVSWDAGSDSDHDSAELGDAGEAQGDASAAESAALGTAADSTSEELARLAMLAQLTLPLPSTTTTASSEEDGGLSRPRARPRSRSRSRPRPNSPAGPSTARRGQAGRRRPASSPSSRVTTPRSRWLAVSAVLLASGAAALVAAWATLAADAGALGLVAEYLGLPAPAASASGPPG